MGGGLVVAKYLRNIREIFAKKCLPEINICKIFAKYLQSCLQNICKIFAKIFISGNTGPG